MHPTGTLECSTRLPGSGGEGGIGLIEKVKDNLQNIDPGSGDNNN